MNRRLLTATCTALREIYDRVLHGKFKCRSPLRSDALYPTISCSSDMPTPHFLEAYLSARATPVYLFQQPIESTISSRFCPAS
ncbi:hypothetical protein C0Q70_17421 [Pomacea canaliculata]|uniref:Uncharacterized protein n=1 Tax=Pomacea canaliculata TaxID=400727 RepID=A0A2T7NKC7_POMCA|nr:hypothetical protein C0Q70_17421 [Pomacea canaliculata]